MVATPAYRQFLDEPAFAALPTLLDRLPCRTLLVAGELDALMPTATIEAAAARTPGTRIEYIARCGHFPEAERPQELIALLRDFWRTLNKS